MANERTLTQRQDLKAVEGPPGIFRTTVAFNAQTMLCHFNMNVGAEIPLHNHDAVQNGMVLSGKIEFKKGDGSTFIAQAGTGYAFGPNEQHGATVLEKAEVIECFAPMRPEYADNL